MKLMKLRLGQCCSQKVGAFLGEKFLFKIFLFNSLFSLADNVVPIQNCFPTILLTSDFIKVSSIGVEYRQQIRSSTLKLCIEINNILYCIHSTETKTNNLNYSYHGLTCWDV